MIPLISNLLAFFPTFLKENILAFEVKVPLLNFHFLLIMKTLENTYLVCIWKSIQYLLRDYQNSIMFSSEASCVYPIIFVTFAKKNKQNVTFWARARFCPRTTLLNTYQRTLSSLVKREQFSDFHILGEDIDSRTLYETHFRTPLFCAAIWLIWDLEKLFFKTLCNLSLLSPRLMSLF